jgi:hypothetical protein
MIWPTKDVNYDRPCAPPAILNSYSKASYFLEALSWIGFVSRTTQTARKALEAVVEIPPE